MKTLLTTKEAAQFLEVNEKMVYALISEKGLPATKVTGKWLFPRHLVEQWIENHTINFPDNSERLPPYHGLLILAGSNDLLLDQTITLFNTLYTDHLAVFGNLGSTGGLRALNQGLCHVAASHLLQDDGEDYNFEFVSTEMDCRPITVNFCRREQGLMVAPGSAKRIKGVADLGQPGIRIVNRPLGTGTRLLFDRELKKAGLRGDRIRGYGDERQRHMEVGIDILCGKADAGPGIRPVAATLGLTFVPIRWERYDLLVREKKFFEKGIQMFFNLMHEKRFAELAEGLTGYDVRDSGKVVFPRNP